MIASDDWLSHRLQQAEPYLADNGFTEAVIGQLEPRPASRLSTPLARGLRFERKSPLNPFLLAAGVTSVGSIIATLGVSQTSSAVWQSLTANLHPAANTPELLTLLAAGWFSALLISGLALLKLR
jgi:dihydroorotate dehydrogenase